MSKKVRLYLFIAVALIGIAFFALLLTSAGSVIPEIWHILQSTNSQGLETYLRSFGMAAGIILFFLQFLQSLLPIFPAIVLQIVAGVLYGPIWGTIIITVGNGLANYLVFCFLRRYDQEKIDKLLDFKAIHKLKIYFQSKNPNTIVFLFYLMPFLTNAFVPYLAATTKISKRGFLFSMISATLPMTFLSVYLGDTIIRGQWRSAITLSIVIVIFTLIAFFLKDPLLRLLRQKKSSSKQKN